MTLKNDIAKEYKDAAKKLRDIREYMDKKGLAFEGLGDELTVVKYVMTIATYSKNRNGRSRLVTHVPGNENCKIALNRTRKVKREYSMTAKNVVNMYNKHRAKNKRICKICVKRVHEVVMKVARPDWKDCEDCGKETYIFRYDNSKKGYVPVCLGCKDGDAFHRYVLREESENGQ